MIERRREELLRRYAELDDQLAGISTDEPQYRPVMDQLGAIERELDTLDMEAADPEAHGFRSDDFDVRR